MNMLEEIRDLFGMIIDHTDQIQNVKLNVKMKNGAHIKYAFDRKKWERKQVKDKRSSRPISDIFNAVIDIVGITVSIAVLVLLSVFYGPLHMPDFLVVHIAYGSLLVLYFFFSSMYHFMDETYAARQFFFMLTSTLQFIVVGVSFITINAKFIGGSLGTMLYFAVVLIGIVGLFLAGRNTKLSRKVSTAFLIAMAWLWLPGFFSLVRSMNFFYTVMIIIGCVFYTLWAIAANREKENEHDFIAPDLYLLLSIFPFFTVFMRMILLLPVS